MVKQMICTGLGLLGGMIAGAFGGWDAAMAALVICMAIDYISGSLVALVFHNSRKTASGTYHSGCGLKGLCRKGMMLLFVLTAVQIDRLLGTAYVRDAVCIGFCTNEMISIIENLGLAGVPIPKVITAALEQLQSKQSTE